MTFPKDDDEPKFVVGETRDYKPDAPKKKPFLRTRKGIFVAGFALILACFWTAYALDFVLNEPPVKTVRYDLTAHCYSDVQTRTADDSLVYMGFECTPEVTMNELLLAIEELKYLATNDLGFDELRFPFIPGQLLERFQNPSDFIGNVDENGDPLA